MRYLALESVVPNSIAAATGRVDQRRAAPRVARLPDPPRPTGRATASTAGSSSASGAKVAPIPDREGIIIARRGFMGYPGDASTNFGAYIEPVYDVDIAGAGFARLPESRLVPG